MIAVIVFNILVAGLFAIIGSVGWALLAPYFGMEPFSLQQIAGLTLILICLRQFLAPRVTNVSVPTPMMMPKFTPAEFKRLTESLSKNLKGEESE